MFFIYPKLWLTVFFIIELAVGQSVSNLTPKQRSRIRPSYINEKETETSVFDKRSRYLYGIIHSRPENGDIEFKSCDSEPLKLPDFRTHGLRISDVKCLEHLWKMRYYDQALLSVVLCEEKAKNLNLINLNFGGYDAVAGEYPHMGAIGWLTRNDTWLFMCEGALISEKYMLTTVKCTQLQKNDERIIDKSPGVVRFGVADLSDKEEIGKSPTDVFISKIHTYPYYYPERNYYDLAIVELDRELVFSAQVHPACLWTDLNIVTGKGMLAGWNVVESNKSVVAKEFLSDSFDVFTRLTLAQKITPQEKEDDISVVNPVMQFTEVDYLPPVKCDTLTRRKRNGRWSGLLNHQLCAGRTRSGNNSECQMDLGTVLNAPIKIPEYSDWKMHYVIGVRSFDLGCDLPLTLSVYSRASTFLDWIERIVWDDEFYKN